MGVADEFGVALGTGLQIHVVSPHPVVGKELRRMFREYAERGAYTEFRQLVSQRIDDVQYGVEFGIGFAVSAAAGHDTE